MNAIELKFSGGKGTGFWYCSRCLQVQTDTRPNDNVYDGKWNTTFSFWRDHGDSRRNQEEAEECCSSKEFRPLCTGCHVRLEMCTCGRAKKNLCAGCNRKLFVHEGEFIEFGATKREFCPDCAKTLHAKLADAGKYIEYPGLDSAGYLLK